MLMFNGTGQYASPFITVSGMNDRESSSKHIVSNIDPNQHAIKKKVLEDFHGE